MFDNSSTRAFVIYHPALTYFARAYSIEQIAVEEDGKEPSARHIATLIDAARTKGVTCLLYQSQFPRSVVDVIARDMGVEPTQINPLEANPLLFIENVTHIITQK
jgi:zinc transport system substrate-binding protein